MDTFSTNFLIFQKIGKMSVGKVTASEKCPSEYCPSEKCPSEKCPTTWKMAFQGVKFCYSPLPNPSISRKTFRYQCCLGQTRCIFFTHLKFLNNKMVLVLVGGGE